ncbi:ferritin-like domain-containing protein [Sphingomonas sp.]|uniref:ferritin-like domain-containing protein n=1 Tax=Sphingomonas sp. TaxID=28214 RepID=UPI0035BC8CAC
MSQTEELIEALDSRVRRREERRAFFKVALGAAAVGAGAFAVATPAAAQAVTDNDILNFALNLEYLEAQFYSYAAFGTGIAANLQTGVTTSGPQGAVVIGTTNPARQVNFSGDPLVGQYAREIAADEIAHVAFLRTALAAAAVAQPAINISGDANGPFTAAAKAAGVDLTASGGVFDPYANPNNFLLGSFIFEDVGVTAYKGSAALLTSKVFLEAAAGILAVEAYHSSIVRTSLYARGMATPALQLVETTEKISAARDLLDGTPADDPVRGIGADDDQGIAPVTISGALLPASGTGSNIVPLNSNGLAYSRTAAQVLNIVYLNKAAVTMGGFFPAGVNGTIRTSAAN